MMQRLQRFMYGRYGGRDQLSKFLFITYIVMFAAEIILMFVFPPASRILQAFTWVLVIWYFFRAFSRNIYARSAENQKFLNMSKPIKSYFNYLKMCYKERDSVNKLYRCGKCHQIIRVPKGKGKIAITCPKCRYEFIKKT